MKKLLSVLVVVGLSFAARSALAQPYGTAGCGLGSIIFGKKPGMVQIFAATTNGATGSQTGGITSGTSNCIDEPSGAGATAAFVETNREVLAKDMSRGSGETIATLATLAGCRDSKKVGQVLQSKFTTIFPSSDVTNVEVSGNVVSVLRNDKSLACNKLQATKSKQKPEKKKELPQVAKK
jgi:hypothetical protein